MNFEQPTVSQLVARFQLRQRASTEGFVAGGRLARQGAATIASARPDEVKASVRDMETYFVRIVVDDGGLVGVCSCAAADGTVCRHQVAAAHTLWEHERQRQGKP